jgi:mannose-6-phosphate isomerase-like protein (cupin superfamily)
MLAAKWSAKMQGFIAPIETLTERNRDFRRVLFTSNGMQLVLMALRPGESIGSEIHASHDQFFRIEMGKGSIRIGQSRIKVGPGDAIVVPAGIRHNLTNTGKRRLRLYTIYAPPSHADHLVENTKSTANAHDRAEANALAMETARKDMINEGGPVAATLAAFSMEAPA